MKAEHQALHVRVAEQLIEALRAGTAPWQRPWNSDGLPAFELPYNAVTGKRYQGINTLSLIMSGRNDPRWLTFKQADDHGWQVRKGSKSTPIQYIKLKEQRIKRDEQGKVVRDEKGDPVKITVKLSRPIITSAAVFNAEQIDGIPELVKPDNSGLGWEPLDRAEQLIRSSGAEIRHIPGNEAFYNPVRDNITLPLPAQFSEPARYYATALHELGHWTGHAERLDRSIMNKFGTPEYAREELRAEIASMLIGEELCIGHDPGQHAAYVDSWISLLQDHPFEIHSAAADAEKILTYLIGLERKRAAEREIPEGTTGLTGNRLGAGDSVAYDGKVYHVTEELRNGRLKVEDSSGRQFILSRKDGLYRSLLAARQHDAGLTDTLTASVDIDQSAPEINDHYSFKR